MPHLTEDEIKTMFVTAYNTALVDRDALIEDAEKIKNLLTNTQAEDKDIAKYEAELAIITETANKTMKKIQSRFKIKTNIKKDMMNIRSDMNPQNQNLIEFI